MSSFIFKQERDGKNYYLSIKDVENPKPYFTWTTRIIDATLFGEEVDIQSYFEQKFGMDQDFLDNVRWERQILTVTEINEIVEKYQ